jgi:quinoprotein glucose dehydrogenase
VTYQQNCQMCHGADRLGIESSGPALIANGAPRFDAAAIRAVLAAGKGRMPAQPHLTSADVDNLVTFLTAAAVGGRGQAQGAQGGGGGGGARGARGGAAAGAGAPPELIAGSGSVATVQTGGGRGGRGAARYPDGVPQTEQYVINEYNTVGNRIKPPYTSIVKYDLNEPGIKWRIGFGDDPVLAARGITGTGAAATLNGIIITQAGIVFGAGRDNQIRAWDSDNGKQLWSATFGGNFVGSPVMYEMDGRQYLLVPAAGTAGGGRGAVPTAPSSSPSSAAPLGWVAYALPTR